MDSGAEAKRWVQSNLGLTEEAFRYFVEKGEIGPATLRLTLRH